MGNWCMIKLVLPHLKCSGKYVMVIWFTPLNGKNEGAEISKQFANQAVGLMNSFSKSTRAC